MANKKYDEAFKEQIWADIQNDMSIKEIAHKYKIARQTIWDWCKKKSGTPMKPRRHSEYPASLKKAILEQVNLHPHLTLRKCALSVGGKPSNVGIFLFLKRQGYEFKDRQWSKKNAE